jgi:predicted AAA+ superfamily ATPase
MPDAEFAADLAQVLRGNAPAQYADPVRFFSDTYPTRWLKDLLSNVCGRLSEDKA